MSNLGPPRANSVACQCEQDGCSNTLTVSTVEGRPGVQISVGCDKPTAFQLELPDHERHYLAWLLLFPGEPVPDSVNADILTERLWYGKRFRERLG